MQKSIRLDMLPVGEAGSGTGRLAPDGDNEAGEN